MSLSNYIPQALYSFEGGRSVTSYVTKDSSLTDEHYEEVKEQYRETLHPDIIPLPSSEKFVVLLDTESAELLAVIALSYIHDNAVPLIFNRVPKGYGEKFITCFNNEVTTKTGVDNGITIADAQAGTVAIMTDKLRNLNELVDLSTVLFHESEMVINKYLNRNNIIMIATKPVQKLLRFSGITLHQFPSTNTVFGEGVALTDDEVVVRIKEDLGLEEKYIDPWLNGYINNRRLSPVPGVLIFSPECPINFSKVVLSKRILSD